MADSTHCVKHIETFVESSSSPAQQDASVDAIAKLLKNDALTLESLVREMEMYLTTTDSIIRARGILLLAELLTSLSSKPLGNATVQSLTGFFTERLADWKALRGALFGCLALMRRKGGSGTISGSEARAIAQSFMQNLQVQSLGQHDRKLCFELLGCLLDRYPDTVVALGDDFVYMICEAIDGEKDPQCLILTFHIVEILAQLFPDSSGSLASFAEDLFDILGSYFPIHFTHPKGEDDVKREELSTALMMAFASTPLFEPFAIPLLLEKLSSSLPSAKAESLKYLGHCVVEYGADRMLKHVKALWSSLKDAIFSSEPSVLPLNSDSLDSIGFQDNQVVTEALVLLQKTIEQNNDFCLSLIVNDEDIMTTVNSLANFKGYEDIPLLSKQRLRAVGRILYCSARVSVASCNTVFISFFPHLVNALGINSSGNTHPEKAGVSGRPNFGYLYLCVELLAACRSLVVFCDESTSISVSGHEAWCSMLHRSCSSLTMVFSSSLITSMNESTQNAYVHSGVKGLQMLATFPGSFLPVSKSIFENILLQLMSIATLEFDKTFRWKLVLKALVDIGSFIEKSHDSEKIPGFDVIVVERMVSLISSDDFTMPSSLKVEAVTDIGMTGLNFMLKIVQEMNKAISTSLTKACVHGDLKSADLAVHLLECYSFKVLPWFQNVGGFEEVPLQFAVKIWVEIKDGASASSTFLEKKLLEATMTSMKYAVASCSEEGQIIVLDKAFSLLSKSTTFIVEGCLSDSTLIKPKGLQLSDCIDGFSCRDEWIISLFASVIIALRPQTHIKNVELVLQLFMTTLLNGHVPSAQALGSLLNKLPSKGNTFGVSEYCSLEGLVDVIFNNKRWRSSNLSHLANFDIADGDRVGLSGLRVSSITNYSVHVHAIVGLAWMGKGLLMRGHEKVKDILLSLMSCLLCNADTSGLSGKLDSHKDSVEQEVLQFMRYAADSFHIIMSDSEASLNRRFHAVIRPLYKQRFFNIVMPILLSSILKSDSPITRSMLHRALAHVISDTPLGAILGEANKLIPLLLDGLSILSEDILNQDIVYNILLILSAILMDKNGQEAVVENAHIIIGRLIELISYPHMMLIRDTSIQCLTAMSELPHARLYPMRTQVLQAISRALDDPKRTVRQEAVRCRQSWAPISSRSLHL